MTLDPAKVHAVYARYTEQLAVVAALDAQLKEAEAVLREIEEAELPEAMCGFTSLGMPDGLTLTVETKISSVSPLAQDREDVYDWIIESGDGGLLKHEVTASFAIEEAEKAGELARALSSEFDTKTRRWVEPATMTRYIKTMLEKGEPVPMDKFFIKQKTKVTLT